MNKTVIIILIAVGTISLLGLIVFKIMSSSGGDNDHKCLAPNKYFEQYDKCLACDPNDKTCGVCTKSGGECKNGSTCFLPIDGNKGVCECKAPFTGKLCGDSCSKGGSECKNGSVCALHDSGNYCKCSDGWAGPTCETATTCSADHCDGPGCEFDPTGRTCTCKDGWVTDTNNDDFPNLCTTCEPGRGPPLLTNSGGQPTNANVACTRKYFSGAEGIKIPTFTCYNTDIDKHATFEAGCHYEWPGSSYADDWCHNDGDCTVAEDHILCNVPQYWAYPNFDHAAWGECSASHGEHGASQFRSRYGGMPADPQ